MDVTRPTHHFIQKASFHLLTPEQIRKISVKCITKNEIFDVLNHPVKGGLYDPALGPVDRHGRCSTCGLGAQQCPGHFGHIELAVPVYAPLTFAQLFQVLRQMCTYCHRFRGGDVRSELCRLKLRLLDAGFLNEAKELDEMLHQRESLDDSSSITAASIIIRLNEHVEKVLSTSPDTSVRVASVADYRARVVNDFLKRSSASNVCMHCKGYIPGLYRHGGTKIFMTPLRKNQQLMMDAKNMTVDQAFVNSTNEDNKSMSDDTENEDNAEELDLAVNKSIAEKGMRYLTPLHIHEYLRLLWQNESELCSLLFGSQVLRQQNCTNTSNHSVFFTQVIAVPPTRFRPPTFFNGAQFDHPQNTYLQQIIRLNADIINLRSRMNAKGAKSKVIEQIEDVATVPSLAELVNKWIELQEQVNYLFDSSKNTKAGKMPPPGVKQILEKKEGLFRKHMMGKRVNYAARSVISPDPYLDTSEIGVPMVFAKKLTYPEPVTEHNVATLRQAVINGPKQHPGASHVQLEDGTLANLETMSKSARIALANQLLTPSMVNDDCEVEGGGASGGTSSSLRVKRVMRHVKNNDIVLMNRQPTLHKPSMMAHRVRVLPGEKTIRMHYANCNTYNADFDGDEMNMHFPQSELARAEAYLIANTNNQYLVPTDGSPLRGLIQDHIVTGVILTMKDTWLTREEYQQLLWGSLPESIGGSGVVRTLPPAIVRPRPLWSGKQVISTILLNIAHGRPAINMSAGCKISAKMWGPSHAEEAQVLIQDGYLVHGILDKAQIGASAYGLTHAVFELYGPDAAGMLLSTMGRLLTRYDQFIGFTCRMDDLLLTKEANHRRRSLIDTSHSLGRQVVAEYSHLNNNNDREGVAQAMEKILRSDELLKGLDGVMKVKMNEMTSRIIEACLPEGQLRPFPSNNMSLMTLSGAKGSMVNFSQIAGALGQQELEGRRVPTMVSGKTHPAFPSFDPRARAGGYISQRFLTGIRPPEFFFHCMAGREGLIDTAVKTSRSGYLQRCLIKHLESLKVSYDGTVRDSADQSILQFHYGEDGLDVVRQKYLRNFPFAARNLDIFTAQVQAGVALERVNTEAAVKASRKTLKKPHRYEPVLSRYNPNVFLGSTSEKFAQEMETFLASPEGHSLVPDQAKFKAVMWLRYMKSLADAGEAVGLLAAQSVGEPSTQMTLNTFHFAGFGAKNVTLGIPRLREIVMTASQKIKTPSLTVPLVANCAVNAEELARRLSKLTLKQIIQDIGVEEVLISSDQLNGGSAVNVGKRARIYRIQLSLLPLSECQETFSIDLADIKEAIENGFVKVMMSAIEKTLKKMKLSSAIISVDKVKENISRAKSTEADDGDAAERGGTSRAESSSSSSDDDEPTGEDLGAKKSIRQQAQLQDRSEEEEANEDVDNDSIEKNDEVAMTDNETVAVAAKSLLAQTRSIRNYQFNPTNMTVKMDLVTSAAQPKLLLLDLLERSVSDVVVRQILGISRVFPHRDDSANESSPPTGITTEGANLRGLWDHPLASHHLDLRHLLTNDVYAMLTTYGVEAARATIVREVAAVFAVYGISVDPRHLSLIADYMTVDGRYRPFNRMGMQCAAASPLLQMTFETTMGFLRSAALMGEWDECNSPSARIVLGLPVNLGTGSLQIRQPF